MVDPRNGQKWDRAAIPAGTKIGRYLVAEKIAEGGMAEVYRASALGAQGFTKEVVLKIVLPALAHDDEFIDMFIAEARLASKLSHSNIVQIFDFGKHDERYFIAMEYVRGVSLWRLRSRCRQLKVSFPPILAAAICADVAKGLQHAHSLREGGRPLNVVHRDVTPHNVLLSVDGAVKLTDFGIAKAGNSNTRPGILKGKFPYMSPEQARGEPVDCRTDVFALGILLWELLTGRKLFTGDTDIAVLYAVQRAPIVSPRTMGAHVPEELAAVALKALARPLSERYQTAADFDRDLMAFVLANAKTVEDTSVAQFLVAMFPPQDDFQSPIQPSVAEPEAPKEESVRTGFAAVKTAPLPGTPPSPKREAHPPNEPPEFPTIPVLALLTEGTGTDRMPGGRAASGPSFGTPPAVPSPESPATLMGDAFPRVVDEALPSSEAPPTLMADAFPLVLEDRASSGKARTVRLATSWRTGPGPDLPAAAVPAGRPRRSQVAIGALALLAVGGVCVLAVSLRWEKAPAPRALAAAPRSVEHEQAPPSSSRPEGALSQLPDGGGAPQDAGISRAPGAPGAPESVELPRPVPPEGTPLSSMGRLTVHAIPFARVTVRGKSLGEVMGTRSFRLAPGTYEVQLIHSSERVVRSVTIRAGEESHVDFNVTRQQPPPPP